MIPILAWTVLVLLVACAPMLVRGLLWVWDACRSKREAAKFAARVIAQHNAASAERVASKKALCPICQHGEIGIVPSRKVER